MKTSHLIAVVVTFGLLGTPLLGQTPSKTPTPPQGSTSTTPSAPSQENTKNKKKKKGSDNSAKDYAPGRSNNKPPGQGGTAPGQAKKK